MAASFDTGGMSKDLLHIFKPGTHTSMEGAALSFTESDLAASAAAYDPAVHEAPICVGHPEHNLPAYGWVKSLQAKPDGLYAEEQQVDPAFAELRQAGRFKKISASFYAPDSPSNPKPGVWYLRHVAFLGAQPPAVKGLRSAQFSDGAQGVVTVDFADWDGLTNASLWRRMRDWVIGRFGLDEADKVIPDYQIAALEEAARREDMDDGLGIPPSFSEPTTPTQENPMSQPDQAAVLAAEKAAREKAEAELREVNAKLAEFAEQAARSAAATRQADAISFAETHVKAGRLLPAEKNTVVALLTAGQQGTEASFGEGDGAVKGDTSALLKKLIEGLPVRVTFGEAAPATNVDPVPPAAGVSLPAGANVDPERLALHAKAVAYSEANGVDYATAASIVSNQSA